MNIVEKKEKQRRNILKASLFVFAHHGFENTKLDRIAIKAKVGKGTIYNYFRDKVALYQAVVSETMEQLFTEILNKSALHENVADTFTAGITATFEFFEANPDRYLIYLRSFGDGLSSSKQDKLPILFSKFSIFEPRLRECIKKGLVQPPGATTEDLILSFLGLINSFLYKWYSSRKTYDFRSKIPVIAKIYAHGVFKND